MSQKSQVSQGVERENGFCTGPIPESLDTALTAAELDENAAEHIAERTAIAEVDGERPPDEAARLATERVYEFRLSDEPDAWLRMLCAYGDELPEVEASLRIRFGPDRLIEVRKYQPGRAN